MSPWFEERLACVIAAGGVCWGVYNATSHVNVVESMTAIMLELGPLELCGLAVLAWLHAKYRRAMPSKPARTIKVNKVKFGIAVGESTNARMSRTI